MFILFGISTVTFLLSFDFNGNLMLGNFFLNNNISNESKLLYPGYLYNLNFYLKNNSFNLVLSLKNATASGYAIPIYNKGIETIYMKTSKTQIEDFIPYVNRLFFNLSTSNKKIKFKVGLFKEKNQFFYLLNNKYSNYGISLSLDNFNYEAKLHFELPDYNNKWVLGKRNYAGKSFIFNHTKAKFYSLYLGKMIKGFSIAYYVSYLNDNTDPEYRTGMLQGSVFQDKLYTTAITVNFGHPLFFTKIEFLKNFGNSLSKLRKIKHKGHLFYFDQYFFTGIVNLGFELIYATGPKLSKSQYGEPQWNFDNYSFSFYSPFNLNLFDTRYPFYYSSIISGGGGYGLNYGIPRPGIFSDPHLIENVKIYKLYFEVPFRENFSLLLNYYWLRTYFPPLGMFNNEIIKLPSQLGREFDIIAFYKFNKVITSNLLFGYFKKGAYYKAKRDDNNPWGIYPIVENLPDNLYQIEFLITISF